MIARFADWSPLCAAEVPSLRRGRGSRTDADPARHRAQHGFRGEPRELLDAETNLLWAVEYLRGAWLVADGDEAGAVGWYARGYYYAARNRCMLVETGLRTREIARACRG